jgi:hypothetical protein
MTRTAIQRPGVTLDADAVLRIAYNPERTFSAQADVITYAYHELALAMARKIGNRDANWFTFATWASRAVGQNLNLSPASTFWRRLAKALHVPQPMQRFFRWILVHLLGGSYFKGLSLANRSIFLEMGTFAAYLWSDEPRVGIRVRPRQPVAREFVSSLLGPVRTKDLAAAAHLLRQAASTNDPARRSELILGANVALVAYEQARAQKVLEFVVYRSVRWLLRVWWRAALHWLTPWREFHRFRLYAEPHSQQSWPVRVLEERWARLYTRFLAFDTPLGEIRAGGPLPTPPDFDPLAVPPPYRNEQVQQLVDRFGAPRGADACTPTRNWLSYDERMRFIVCYFRLYQRTAALFEPPYGSGQAQELVAQLGDGELPDAVSVYRPEGSRQAVPVDGQPPSDAPSGITRFFRLPWPVDPEARKLDDVRLEDNLVPQPDLGPSKL